MSKPVCYDCREGTLSEEVDDYKTRLSDRHTLIVPNIRLGQCSKCDTIELPPDSWQKVEDATLAHKTKNKNIRY